MVKYYPLSKIHNKKLIIKIMKNRYAYLCKQAEEMNEEFKSEGSSDRAIVICDTDEFKIMILRKVK